MPANETKKPIRRRRLKNDKAIISPSISRKVKCLIIKKKKHKIVSCGKQNRAECSSEEVHRIGCSSEEVYQLLAKQAEARAEAYHICAEQASVRERIARAEYATVCAAQQQQDKVWLGLPILPRTQAADDAFIKATTLNLRSKGFQADADYAEAEAEAFSARAEEAEAEAEAFHARAEEVNAGITLTLTKSTADYARTDSSTDEARIRQMQTDANIRATEADARASFARTHATEAEANSIMAHIHAAQSNAEIERFDREGFRTGVAKAVLERIYGNGYKTKEGEWIFKSKEGEGEPASKEEATHHDDDDDDDDDDGDEDN